MVWTEESQDNENDNDNADYLATFIHAIIMELWGGTFDFKPWDSGTLPLVPKNDISNPNKWRSICLLKAMYK
eukprot:906387-Ditylum_brightwellii.AAC.1